MRQHGGSYRARQRMMKIDEELSLKSKPRRKSIILINFPNEYYITEALALRGRDETACHDIYIRRNHISDYLYGDDFLQQLFIFPIK